MVRSPRIDRNGYDVDDLRIGNDGSVVFGFGAYFRQDGTPCERTPITHPYSFEEYVQWRHPRHVHGVVRPGGSCYTDRLLQWDFAKHDELCQKHFGNRGQWWNDRPPEKIEAFLRDWTGNPDLCLLEVIHACNQASGYPVWAFIWADKAV